MGSQSGQFLFVISKKMLMINTTSRTYAHIHRVLLRGSAAHHLRTLSIV